MKKRIKHLKVLLFLMYLILTATSIIMIFWSYILSPFDMDHEARFGELAIGGAGLVIAWLAFAYNAIKNIIVGLIAGYFNKRLLIFSLALGLACLLNFIGMCFLP